MFLFFVTMINAFVNEDGGPFAFTLIVSSGFASICCFTITLLMSFQSGKVGFAIFSIVFLITMIYFQICLLAPAMRFLRTANIVQEYPVNDPDSGD